MISCSGYQSQDGPGLLNIKDKISCVFIVFNCADLFSILKIAFIFIVPPPSNRGIYSKLLFTQTAAKILRRDLTTLDPQ